MFNCKPTCYCINVVIILIFREPIDPKTGISIVPEIINESIYNFTVFHKKFLKTERLVQGYLKIPPRTSLSRLGHDAYSPPLAFANFPVG